MAKTESDWPGCPWCDRTTWHERWCPVLSQNFPGTSSFASQAADTPEDPPLIKVGFDKDGNLETMQMVASDQRELEWVNGLLNEIDLALQERDHAAASQLLQEAQQRIHNLLR